MPPQFVLTLQDVNKFYGDVPILKEFNLSFFYGAKIGIVGENGTGKSTLLRILAGEDKEVDGVVKLAPNMRVCHVPQEPRLALDKTVRENLEMSVAPIRALSIRYEEIGVRLGEGIEQEEMDALLEEMDAVQQKIDAADAWELDRTIDIASDALVLPPDDMLVQQLSGGERRRVALCKALLEKPDLLLLDEPTNHLDAETIQWLEGTLCDYHGTVIIVTHDRYFLDNVTKWVLEIEDGHGIPYEGNYSSWLAQKAERLRQREKKETERQRILQRELEWINSGTKGRLKQNQARVSRYEELSSQAFEVKKSEVVIQVPPGPHLGDRVISFNGVSKGYNGVTLLDGCSFELPKGAIVGIIGPNGAGKTTLFRMITGQETPDDGAIDVGPTVMLSHVDQNRDALNDANTIYEEISGGNEEIVLGSGKMNARGYVSRFNFRGAQQQKKVGQCSGGERNRIHLAKLLRTGGNVLLLDEPTNDLDVNTMRVLEQALIDFPACAMVISHDRFFLDRICSHLLIFEGNGKTTWFLGTYSEYEENVLRKSDRLEHRRSKYRRISVK